MEDLQKIIVTEHKYKNRTEHSLGQEFSTDHHLITKITKKHYLIIGSLKGFSTL